MIVSFRLDFSDQRCEFRLHSVFKHLDDLLWVFVIVLRLLSRLSNLLLVFARILLLREAHHAGAGIRVICDSSYTRHLKLGKTKPATHLLRLMHDNFLVWYHDLRIRSGFGTLFLYITLLLGWPRGIRVLTKFLATLADRGRSLIYLCDGELLRVMIYLFLILEVNCLINPRTIV